MSSWPAAPAMPAAMTVPDGNAATINNDAAIDTRDTRDTREIARLRRRSAAAAADIGERF
jgi:hypothetical protein